MNAIVKFRNGLTFLLVFLACAAASAQTVNVVQDNFTRAAANLSWSPFNGACLTAGNDTGSIPSCKNDAYYGNQTQTGLTNNQDPVGYGALRLTNGCANGTCYYHQNGAIMANTPFPTDQGIQVTFTTYTYGGDNAGGHGADGIGFYLMDGSDPADIGAWGGSLGYTCSNANPPYNGMVGAYLGLGIDEYGNFLNQGDNTATGYNYKPGRIGLRGYGNISWNWLNANYPLYYPSNLSSSKQQAAVQNTCKTGHLWDYSSTVTETDMTVPDYLALPNAYMNLPSSQPIANESVSQRTQATPITYKLKITQDGLLSFWYSYNGGTYTPVLTDQSITASNGPLPASFKFGFGGSTGGSDNVHEITCFQATPANQSASSAGINVQQAGEVRTGTQVYMAFYHSNNWWGQLDANDLLVNSTTGAVSISQTANWDASCVLTGGRCAATGATAMVAQGPSARNLLTWDGTQGVALTWSNLPSSEQSLLNAGDNDGQQRLAYLSGDRSNEITSLGSGLFRARNSVLGDIIHSSPTWVGPPQLSYPNTWQDLLYPSAAANENSGQSYGQFESADASRLNVVYDGSNDGFLHGFRSGSYDSSGNYVNNSTTPNDGREVLAYMPQAVLATIHDASNPAMDFSSEHYSHNYYADATPGTGDLFYNGTWHTWLVSGLGAGGPAIFALDITDPTAFSGNAASIVKGEWNPTDLVCASDTSTSKCGADLGQTYGTPQIRRLHNGEWAIIFGNGLNSATGHAGIYIMTVDPATGNPSTVYFIDTGVGTSSKPDGIAYVTTADLDGDHVSDYVYAGDVYGNVWRFDLTSNVPTNWHVSSYGSGASPLFSTPGSQPITTQLSLLSTPASSGPPRVMVDFGTGQSTPQTNTSAAQYAAGQQSLYGIWDWNMGQAGSSGSGWNAMSPSAQYASLTGTSSAPSSISTGDLQQQSITSTTNSTQNGSGQGYRTVSNTAVCFTGSTCTTTNSNGTPTTTSGSQFGWYLDLPGYAGVSGVGGSNQTEQLIYNPIETYGAFIVNTTVPANNSPFTCTVQTALGWTMAINPATGGAFPQSFFDSANSTVAVNGAAISGIALNATGSPSVVTAMDKPYLVNQTATGVGTVNQINPPGGSRGGRQTWIELH